MKSYADNTNWVNFATLNSSEVYTYASSTAAKQASLSSFLEGAFTSIGSSTTATSPAIAIATADPKAKVPTAADDLLVGGGEGSCARIASIDAAIKADADTVALNNRITQYLENVGYWTNLKTFTGDSAATTDTLYKVARMIDASKDSPTDFVLQYALTSTQKLYNDVAVNAASYNDLAAADDVSNLRTWELQQMIIEASKVLRGNTTMANTVILKKYFTQAATDTKLPKLISISGGESNIKSLLGLFNNLFLEEIKPGSTFNIDFYECQWNCYWYDRYKVEVVYCPDGSNLSSSCTILDYDRWVQDWRGSARAYNLEDWLTRNL